MKRYFLLIVVALCGLFFSCSKTTQVIIDIHEVSEGDVVVVYQDPDMIKVGDREKVVTTTLKNGKCEINLDTIQFEGKRKECSVTITNRAKNFVATLPLIVEKGKTITLRVTGVGDYLAQKNVLQLDYKGSKFAERFSKFWGDINNSFMELSRRGNDNNIFVGQVKIIKDFIKEYPDSGYPYSILMSEIQVLSDKQNPILQYCTELSNTKSNNPWQKYLVEMYKEKMVKRIAETMFVFSAQNKDGKTFTERDIKGKVILVDFWASWCKPCHEIMPKIREIYKKYKDKGLTVVSISVDTNPNDWLKYIEKNPFEWISLLGNGQEITQRYNFQYIPYIMIVNEKGKILQQGIGMENVEEVIKQYLDKEN